MHRSPKSRRTRGSLVLLVPAVLLLAFLFVPLLGLVLGTTVDDVRRALGSELLGPAIGLSLITTLVSLVVIVLLGTPLAWLLARGGGRTLRAVETLVELPVVVPPAVVGVALLLAFGRQGLFSRWLLPAGGSLALTTTAVVLAQIFVAAPFYVLSARSALREVDDELVLVARSRCRSPSTRRSSPIWARRACCRRCSSASRSRSCLGCAPGWAEGVVCSGEPERERASGRFGSGAALEARHVL